ncbi:MAG: oligoendopeptidase F [Parachlamydiaceae bacterium]|nr:oligoendopeptidase F [Parachlamydiaceae bacterium]
MIKKREDVPFKDRWNVEALYSSESEWIKAFKSFVNLEQTPRWPALQKFQGTLQQGPENLKKVLESLLQIERELSKLHTYAHLRHDEEITNTKCKEMDEQILSAIYAYSQETSWFLPELMGLSNDLVKQYLSSPILKDYHFYIEKMLRVKPHTLSPENEKLMAFADQALQTAHKTFRAINDADFKFGTAKDSKGQEKPITHASYGMYIRDADRTLRETAFKQYHQQFDKYENTLCELLTGQLQSHVFNSKARHYKSCLDAALYPKNIDTSVYHALIKAVNERLEVLHKYMGLRKQILGVKDLHFYDTYVPLIEEMDIKMPYEEAEDLIIESVAPLGSEYQNLLKKGFKEQRWVDRYENENKRSGAYSSGCYDSMPYILMNYKNIIKDVFTLAHEAGHSMHSLYSHRSQPYQYGDYPIFLAEVASTFNEDLLMRLMLQRCQNPAEKIYLLNQKIEDIRGTLFRQTMFAEFELLIHEKAEQNIPLTPHLLKEEYRNLNKKYFGPTLVLDKEIDIEWARIPHFYYNFYVFQYATGISAALALAERVVQGGTRERDDYLNFLKSGSSKYPIEILKLAGIDMGSPEPVKAAIQKFDHLLDEMEQLLLENSAQKKK